MSRLQKYIPFLFLAYAIPSVLFLCFNVPPYQVADELAHFLKAEQISTGSLIGIKSAPDSSGAYLDENTLKPPHLFNDLPAHPGKKVSVNTLEKAREFKWSGKRIYTQFSNSVIYPPFFYIPQAIGIVLGKAANLSIIQTFYLSRLLNAFSAIALSFLALRWCRRGKALLFTMLLLPMTLFQFASVSQDALLIATACLVTALISRVCSEQRPAKISEYLTVLIGLTLIIMARPPYIGFALLLFLSPFWLNWKNVQTHHLKWRLGALASVLIAAALWIFIASKLQVISRVDKVVSMSAQLEFLIGHLTHIPAVLFNTLQTFGLGYFWQLVGVLGWLDTVLPAHYYTYAAIIFGCALLAEGSERSFLLKDKAVTLLALLSSVGAIFAIQYLTWTPVGSPIIEGVQGRYFLALLPLIGFLMVQLPKRLSKTVALISWLAISLFPLVSFIYLTRTIITRYYLIASL